jgi:excisionase family DNA binding protein
MLLRVREAAQITGYSTAFMYTILARGELPVVRVGRSIRIPADALATWIRAKAERFDGEPFAWPPWLIDREGEGDEPP